MTTTTLTTHLMSQHTLIVLLEDRPGILHRTVSLLRRRQFNIASLVVDRSETAGVSRMTLVVDVGDVHRVMKELNRLIEVVAVHDATSAPGVQRETALAKVAASEAQMDEVVALAHKSGARVLERSPVEIIVEITDAPQHVEAFVAQMRAHGLTELMRTGRLAMMRGPMRSDGKYDYRDQADGAGAEDAA